MRALAERYSRRADAYDRMWSPVIEPYAQRLVAELPVAQADRILDVGTGAGVLLPVLQATAPHAEVLGVDTSEGMLAIAARRGAGSLALMDAEALTFPDDHVDVAVIAFVLFHLPHPDQCLSEVYRVLRRGGAVGVTTWGVEHLPAVWDIWEDELTKAGTELPTLHLTDSRSRSDTPDKMRQLMHAAGFEHADVRLEQLVHVWKPDVAFEYQRLGPAQSRLAELDPVARYRCLDAIRERLATATPEDYTYRGEVIVTTAIKPAA